MMTTTQTRNATMVEICDLAELQRDGVKVVAVEGRTVALFWHQDAVWAVDNRCPHMGFPLSQGTVADGILTCHWHHAKFDLAGGCTFDPFADDVASFRAEVRDGAVWLDPEPVEEERIAHWRRKLREGLEQNLRLVIAKSVLGLCEAGREQEVLREAALFGVRNRASGWASGLSILTAMANVAPYLREEDRPRALYHGVVHVARDVQGQPPDFDLAPLDTAEQRPEQFRAWFRRFAEVRSRDAAERCLRTAAAAGLDPEQLSDLIFSAATDHLFMDVGHTLDFANKACELLDSIGWEHGPDILSSVIPTVTRAQRMEETSSWQHPVDLPRLIAEADAALDEALRIGAERRTDWDGHRAVAESILDDEPAVSLRTMIEAVRDGAPLSELSLAVAYAAARRPVHFHISNEFGDWNTVHHTFTYTNAVDRAMQRAPSRELARGILDGAMSVYLERFLNLPKQVMPNGRRNGASADHVLGHFDRQQQVDETAQTVADLLAAGERETVVQTLGQALLREDAGFHSFQIYEAALRLVARFGDRPEADDVLIGAARFLTAHAPTVRSMGQTWETARRLHRGEALHA
jgi:nitrite reductase/ring-hydroxylating ferredoxin subunit